ncbi:DUF2020 domain-containing protein [Corynebacterium sp. 153RC1]|uniref:DUF2020 domain-containing protein n=1 Tax=unclassified Corynebacterium TaxID=2624378 RepID=UPI00211C8288|nr:MULTISPECIES: DUF2020 domain-containing protein [unclassified Corynebacterium]MCQ9353261.1 DUF2020 domain-containing protein [Corynebacterium sp. 209RC1]MCQ9355401.1 DUF2020 domain-containing protein [Corynebacterium sp. 1222RC1]MCQ9357624.1 DUF2020 domain-containing protein [Corynebacterium sp. 122RC1]MCQ9359769.1 DUF2020 domain-containing protein [Corynebacterium sp. 142RC1]MCQ9361902.1 DUF2020 domain-containing protein [Corynebacterium sp. 153RC1]
MTRTLLLPVLTTAALALSACGNQPSGTETSAQATEAVASASEAAVLDQGLPIDALPEVPGGRESWEECPYLDTQWVADTNGQRMTGVGIDTRFDTPACVFWSYPEEPQATVIVRHMPDQESAIRVVNWAAPIAETEPVNPPADDPDGWMGGRIGNEFGSKYAVQKGNIAVVVFSNQNQSVKAESIALEAINRLGL